MSAVADDSQRHFAFIRAINVGGRRLTNDELIAPFVSLGLDEVAAYQAAGNITFLASDAPARARLQGALAEALDLDSPVFVRSRDELSGVVARTPFEDSAIAGTEGRVQVTFLHEEPDDGAVSDAMELVPDDDLVTFLGREWFWLPRTGITGSDLPVARIEKLIGPMTMRTLGTLERMLARFP